MLEINNTNLESAPLNKLKIIPFGGFGEIGKNMIVFQVGTDIIIIDSGLMFPTEYMLGVDFVICNFDYLRENKNNIRGLFLTHAHEDHIGGVAFLLKEFNIPVFGTELTLGILDAKLKEYDILNSNLNVVTDKNVISLNSFEVGFFYVEHSISGGVGLIINTPIGTIVHSGDFKLDCKTQETKSLEDSCFGCLKDKEVLLLLSDSTNVERPGYSESEEKVADTFEELFSTCKGRIIVTAFASSIPRIQQVLNTSKRHKKRVLILGKSLHLTTNIASQLDYLKIPPNLLINSGQVNRFKDEDIVILTTGSQGEPMSALTLLATEAHKSIMIKKGDTVIISATPVPGNETLVLNTINRLYKLGAEVIYNIPGKTSIDDKGAKIHVSGHAFRDELGLLIDFLKPKFFIPIHGEFRHLIHHARLAREYNIPEENIFILSDGDVLELNKERGCITSKLDAGDVLIDGLGVGDVGKIVLGERKHLSRDGICVIVVVIDPQKGIILSGPQVISRGFIYYSISEEMIQKARELAKNVILCTLKEGNYVRDELKKRLNTEFNKLFTFKLKRRPLILPVIMEI